MVFTSKTHKTLKFKQVIWRSRYLVKESLFNEYKITVVDKSHQDILVLLFENDTSEILFLSSLATYPLRTHLMAEMVQNSLDIC